MEDLIWELIDALSFMGEDFAGFFEDFVSDSWAGLPIIATMIVLLWIGLGVVVYYSRNCRFMFIGHKCGHRRGWRVFFPFFAEYHQMVILDRPWWQMFFFGAYRYVAGATILLLSSLAGGGAAALASILFLAYGIAAIYYAIAYYKQLFEEFGFNPVLSLVRFAPLFNLIPYGMTWIIATDNRVLYKGKQGLGPDVTAAVKIEKDDSIASANNPMVIGVSGVYAGAEFDLSSGLEIIMGRDPATCNVVFDKNDTYVSRRHCSIRFDKNRNSYVVIDSSHNGTFQANGSRLIANTPTYLPRGSNIYVGNIAYMFKLT